MEKIKEKENRLKKKQQVMKDQELQSVSFFFKHPFWLCFPLI